MTNLARVLPGNAAQNIVSGFVSNGVTWVEDVLIVDGNGAQVTGISSDTFQFQFRKERDGASSLVLSTTAGTLTITEGATQTTLSINVPQSSLSALTGDYFADLVSKTAGGTLTHRAHGIITFLYDPIAF